MKKTFIGENKRRTASKVMVPGLARGMAVIEYLAAHPNGCTQKELSKALNIPAAGALRIVAQLEMDGYVNRSDTRVYRLTGRLFSRLRAAFAEVDVLEHALPELRRLSEATGETAVLGVLSDGEITVLDSVSGTEPFHLAVEPGHRVALHSSAPGKALLAALDEDESLKLLDSCPFDAHTSRTIVSRKAFAAQLARVRRTGWALDEQEDFEGVCCAAAAVFGRRGRVVAAVWIAGPSVRLKKDGLRAAANCVAETARRISDGLA